MSAGGRSRRIPERIKGPEYATQGVWNSSVHVKREGAVFREAFYPVYLPPGGLHA